MTMGVSAFVKRLLPALALILFVTVPTACSQSGEQLDGSSNEAFQNSVKAMTESLSGEKRKQFQDAVRFFVMRESFKQAFGGGGQDENKVWENLRQQLGGLTADEVIAKAKAIREKAASRERDNDNGAAGEGGSGSGSGGQH